MFKMQPVLECVQSLPKGGESSTNRHRGTPRVQQQSIGHEPTGSHGPGAPPTPSHTHTPNPTPKRVGDRGHGTHTPRS